MPGMNTLQIIKVIPKFDGKNFVEWARSSNDITNSLAFAK